MPTDLNHIGAHPRPDRQPSQEVTLTNGAPTFVSFDGALAIDRATGDLYERQSGAWVLVVAGGGGGNVQVYHLAGSATPANTPVGAAISYNDDGKYWSWDGSTWNLYLSLS